MSKQVMEQVLGRLIVDPAFRQSFFVNPAESLQGYELADEERQTLLKVKAEDVEQFGGKLGERVTKGKIML